MDAAVPTIHVRSKESGFECRINQADFDEAVWEAVDKKESAAAKKARVAAEAEAKAAEEEARKAEEKAKAKQAKGAAG